MIGEEGSDGFGSNLVHRSKEEDVGCRYVQTLKETTGVTFISYTPHGLHEYIFHIEKTPATSVKN